MTVAAAIRQIAFGANKPLDTLAPIVGHAEPHAALAAVVGFGHFANLPVFGSRFG
jgi:hypothetical protein